MDIEIFKDKFELGKAAAAKTAALIKGAIAANGFANVILATGASQFELLGELIKADIDWSKVTAFHLDEYVGIPVSHPASFRKYMRERFEDKVVNLRKFNYVGGDAKDLKAELKRLADLIGAVTIDVACVGIGENGHLAFNDPPADFDTEDAYIVVELDEACRKQQLGEGWFKTLDDVPKRAISMGIRQIMKSKAIVCTVPDRRKANAVKMTVESNVSNMAPASILQRHPACALMLDKESASLLKG
jgi:glucosamine-6-phosphate deaminase